MPVGREGRKGWLHFDGSEVVGDEIACHLIDLSMILGRIEKVL